MTIRPKRILVLYWHTGTPEKMRAAIRHHLWALDNSDVRHDILYYNTVQGAPAWLRHLKFDAVVLHTTLLCLRWSDFFYSWKWKLGWIGDLKCPKIAMPQDEYDHSEVLDEWLYEWRVSAVLSNFDSTKRESLYPIMHDKVRFYHCLTGYVDEAVARQQASKLKALSDRPNDLVYRATHLPYWFGSHGQLKHQIADIVQRRAKAYGLQCDISTRVEDTIVGDQWLDFLASGKIVIGCESGSSVLDRRGEVRAMIQAMLSQTPGLSFSEVASKLPPGWDDYQFFAISPRHFEAVITKTCQVLIEGRYDGILEANRHYIPLKRDFSNLDEVLEKVRDIEFMQTMAERAYREIYLSRKFGYHKLVDDIERILVERQGLSSSRPNLGLRLMWPVGKLAAWVSSSSLDA